MSGAFGQDGRAVQHGHRLAGAGATGDLGRPGVAHAVGDLVLARVQERAPRGERVGQDQAQLLLVPDLERQGRPCGAEPVAGGEVTHLLVRQDSEQAICVATVRSEHDAAPDAVDSDRADAAIPAVTRRLKERPGVGLPGELGDRRIDRASRVPVQLRVFGEKFLPDRQARHWLHPPWPAVPGWLPKGHAR